MARRIRKIDPRDVGALLTAFDRSPHRRRHGVDPYAVEAVLDARSYVGEASLTRWRPGELSELLCDVLPRKVIADAEQVAATVPSMRAFLDFLSAEGLLAHGSAPLPALLDEVAAVEPRFEVAMADERVYGPAKSLMLAMAADGVPLGDEAAMTEWIAAYNERPAEQRRALTPDPAPPTGRLPLPAVTPAPPAELAAAAAAAPMLADMRTLVGFVGSGRPITQTGNPRLADGKELVALLRTGDRVDPAYDGTVFPTRSVAELPGVLFLFRAAAVCGLLSTSKTRVYPGPLGVDDDPVDTVRRLLGAVLGLGCWAGEEPRYPTFWTGHVDHELPNLLVLLYARTPPSTVEALVDDLEEGLAAEVHRERVPDEVWSRARDGLAAELGVQLERLERLGVVRMGGRALTLTPLGVAVLRRFLVEDGPFDAPTLQEVVGLPVGEVVARFAELELDAAEREMEAWLAAREPAAAAAELAEVIAGGDPVGRQVALAALDRVGEAAEPAVRGLLDAPAGRPYARVWLLEHGLDAGGGLSAEEAAALLVDTCAVLLDAGSPQDLVEQLAQLGPAGEQAAAVRELWRVPGPHTVPVLEAIADAHPDRAVAKAARKAAFSARGVSTRP